MISEEEEISCRFCLEESKRIDFIAPCNCAGTSRWVHRACLDKWRSVRGDKAFSQCTECKAPYDIVCITNDTWNDACWRWTRFTCYFTRDLLLLIVASQLVVLVMSSFVYLCDMSAHSLFKMSKMTDPYSFYYLAGLLLSLSIIGMIAVCFRNQVCGECLRTNPGHSLYCSDMLFPFYIGNESPLACNACCGAQCGELCCAPCANGCTCAECTAAGCGQEMLAVLFVVFIILAIIGVFVAVFIGIVILQHVIRRHATVLHRWNLTKEYIVRDLAPGGLSNEELLHAFSTSSNNRHEEEEEAQDENILSEGISLVHSSYSLTRRSIAGPQGYTRLDGGDDIEAARTNEGSSPRSTSSESLRTASLTMSEDQRQLLVRNNLL